MTPQLLPPTPSPAGGSATAPTATAAADSCLSLPIPAAATVAVPLPGKPNFKLTSAIALGSPCLSLPIPLVLPNGIPSSIACFPKSPKTGPPSLSTVTPKSSTSFAIPTPEPGSQSRLTSTAGIIPLAPHPSRAGPPSLHQTTFGSARLELYDCSDVNLLLRQPLGSRVTSPGPPANSPRIHFPSSPSVSAVVLSKNGAGRLGRCLESIQQTAFADEIVVCIDADTTDDTLPVAKHFTSQVHIVATGGYI